MHSGMHAWAHPRSRGENPLACSWHRLAQGSSPLTRGKRIYRRPRTRTRRLIPAHAGKTMFWSLVVIGRPAHPRSRGENHYEYAKPENVKGSSPLTRGKRGDEGEDAGGEGLIPAHAGKTSPSRWPQGTGRAHPRSRGENVEAQCLVTVGVGSSPLTLGKPRSAATPIKSFGLIPAHAGKTWVHGQG